MQVKGIKSEVGKANIPPRRERNEVKHVSNEELSLFYPPPNNVRGAKNGISEEW